MRFGHRHADQADVAGWFLAGTGREGAGVAPVFGLVSGTGAGPACGAVAVPGPAAAPGYRGAWWPSGGDGEQRQRAHGQDGVPVEGVPQAELVLVEAGYASRGIRVVFAFALQN